MSVEEVAALGHRLLGAHGVPSDEARAQIDLLLFGVGIRASLADLGVAEAHLDRIVDAALTSTRLVANNPRRLDRASLRRIAQAALVGDRDVDRLAG